MSWKVIIKEYLNFSKKDRVGMVALLFLILVAYLIPHFFPEKPFLEPEYREEIDALRSAAKPGNGYTHQDYAGSGKTPEEPITKELFDFDPNQLEQQGWKRLGLGEKTARTIENFRNKGGKFYKPDDLKKVWGISPEFYERVKDHIRINIPENKRDESFRTFPKEKPALQVIGINEADSLAFESLPGIGPKLAGRITGFRKKLGGFHSVAQVAETYGLPDSTFQKIKHYLKADGEVKKINLNTATREELSQHPYIRWKLANAIVEYKKQHGEFKQKEQLKSIFLVDEKTYANILPYVDLNP